MTARMTRTVRSRSSLRNRLRPRLRRPPLPLLRRRSLARTDRRRRPGSSSGSYVRGSVGRYRTYNPSPATIGALGVRRHLRRQPATVGLRFP